MNRQLLGYEVSEYSAECIHSESFAEENAKKAFIARSLKLFGAEPSNSGKEKKIVFSENPLDYARGDARFYTEGDNLVFEGLGYDSIKLAVMLFFDIYARDGVCPQPFSVDEYCEKNRIDKLAYLNESPLVFTDADRVRVEGTADGVALVYWHNHTSLPDETVNMLGVNFENDSTVLLTRLADEFAGEDMRELKPLMVSDENIMFTIPKDMSMGIYSVKIKNSYGESDEVLVNAPNAWWFIADDGEEITENGTVQVMGNALFLNGAARVKLVSQRDGCEYPLDVYFSDEYCVRARASDLPLGRYDIWVHNGYGGECGWSRHDWIDCVPAYKRGEAHITLNPVDDDMFDTIDTALLELEKCGGGALTLTEGEYLVKGPIRIGKGVRLVGEGDVRVNMYGSVNFFSRSEVNNVYFDFLHTKEGNLAYVHGDGVRIYNSTFVISEKIETAREMIGVAFLAQSVKNLVIENSEIYADHMGVDLSRCSFSAIRSCHIKAGAGGIYFRACNRVTAEDNLMTTIGLVAGSSIWPNNSYVGNFFNYVARNRIIHCLWGDREGITYDDHGTYFFGKAAAHGCELVTEYAPQVFDGIPNGVPTHRTPYRKHNFLAALTAHKRDDREWHGLNAVIISGKGMGQFRAVEAIEGNLVIIDRPWDVIPDNSSVFIMGVFNGRHILDKNYIETAACLQTYPPNYESIVANNILYRGGSVVVNSTLRQIDEKPYNNHSGNWRKDAPMFSAEPNILTTVVGNIGITGNHSLDYEGRPSMGPQASVYTEMYEVHATLGTTTKRNDMGAFYFLANKGATTASVLEKNKIHDNFSGIRVDCDTDTLHHPTRFIIRENRQYNTRCKLWTNSELVERKGAQEYEA